MAEPDYRNCEFCGCFTNAKVRACCKRGYVADREAKDAGVPVVDPIRTAAEELLNRLYAEYPEKLPFYCRDAAGQLDEALHPEVFNPDGVSASDSESKC